MNRNILFFFSTTTIGGAETNILKISRELSRRGYSIFWCFLVNNGPMLELVDFEVTSLETGLFYKNYQQCKKRYLSFVRENKIDIVFNFGLRVELISRFLSKKAGVSRMISNIRSTDDWRRVYHTFLDRITQKTVDHWVSNSIAGKEAFSKREKIPSDRITVIYNFIELQDQYISAFRHLTSDEPLRIGILANITLEKGYMDMIDVSKQLTAHGVKHLIKCAGKDMLNNRFHKALAEEGVATHFDLLGYVTDKTAFFNGIDIFLLPSYLEGMPTVLLESMAAGVPVIATNVGGIPELIQDGNNGYLVKPGDIDGITTAIKSLSSPDAYHQLSETGLSTIGRFSKSKIIDQWEKIINPRKAN